MILELEHYNQAAEFVRERCTLQPKVGLVLGSGLGSFVDRIESSSVISTGDIPHWPKSTVLGHEGKVIVGKINDVEVMALQGRTHYYEGHSMSQITLPIRVMQLIGVKLVILTNAAGGLGRGMRAGDLMLLSDHINMVGMGGSNPLRGPNDESLGPRFPDMTEVYDSGIRNLAHNKGLELSIPLHEGVYVAVAGPSFESPADLRFLRLIGADAVGMSTVPEAIVARHGGMKVLAISGITNIAKTEVDTSSETTHDEVLETGKVIVPRLSALLSEILESLGQSTDLI
ncbi:MAG: purine-nucleoside phosphorylase [Chloroflexota bacterium]